MQPLDPRDTLRDYELRQPTRFDALKILAAAFVWLVIIAGAVTLVDCDAKHQGREAAGVSE